MALLDLLRPTPGVAGNGEGKGIFDSTVHLMRQRERQNHNYTRRQISSGLLHHTSFSLLSGIT